MTHFFDILKIWPTFIYREEVSSNTFAKLPVHVLINDPKKMFRKKLYITISQWFETFPNKTFDLAEIGQNVGYNWTIL